MTDIAQHISIVIPYYNDRENIVRCLDSIKDAMARLPEHVVMPEVIVVDDHSPCPFDPGVSRLSVTWHRFSENKGVGAARNKGASLCRGSHILFVDSDVMLDEQHLVRLYHILGKKICPIIQGPTSVIPANEKATLFQHYLARAWNYYERNNWNISVFSQCFLVEKRFFMELGAFSERYARSGGEEFELGLRLSCTRENTICFDERLVHFHHFDHGVKRMKKVYFRSRHIRKIALGMPNLPFRFTAQALLRSAFAWSLNLCLLLCMVSPVEGLAAWLGCALLFHVTDDSMTQAMKKHSLKLSLLSVVFRQLEFTFITLGLLRGLVPWRKHD